MTLLAVAQRITRRTGLRVPTSVITEGDQQSLRLIAAIDDAGKWLAKKASWVRLTKEQLLTTSVSLSSYALPVDFYAMVPATQWNRTSDLRAFGPVRPIVWQQLKGDISFGINDHFRIMVSAFAKQLHVDPTPAAAEIFAFEYRSNSWVLNSASTSAYTSWVSANEDGATSLIDEDLLYAHSRWRFLESIGQPFAGAKDEADEMLELDAAQDGGMQPIWGPGQPFEPVAITPETSIGL